MEKGNLDKVRDCVWEIPQTFRPDMRVPARVYATEAMLDSIVRDRSLEQLVNVAALPGIREHAIAMPDVHEGYGFPIGGIAAIDPDDGVISPGGIGYDINCGVRLLRTGESASEIRPRLAGLVHSLARDIPSGTGRGGAVKLRGNDLDRVLRDGASRAVEIGYGEAADLDRIESRGCIDGAQADLVSEHARERGHDQLGTIGSGNHFVEIDRIDTVFDEEEAERLGLREGGVAVLIHTGSRGLGHQVAADYLEVMTPAMPRYGIRIPDRELACAPFRSPEGQRYFHAMAAAANFAFANRQIITAAVRRAWRHDLGGHAVVDLVYDVAHNVAKIEEHTIGGRKQRLVVHRKGATRAFPGQPVLIPGSMGTASYVLVGKPAAMSQTFGSTCHGAGRVMSRTRARHEIRIAELRERLQRMGIIVEAQSNAGLLEEAPEAYKDIEVVVDVVQRAGIAGRVARLVPMAVIKG